jgi:predicted O-methyltransferase YrrM
MNSLKDPRIKGVIDRLHAQHESQLPAIMAYVQQNHASIGGTDVEIEAGRPFWCDKLAALDPPKAEFCYALCRAMNAKYVVEAGTSFGVSTLYLAAALLDNGGGRVVATEYEADKARAARANWSEAGLSELIDLREGDLRETLKDLEGPADFLLIDVWAPLACPTLELVAPHMRAGAVVIADNVSGRNKDYFAFLNDPKNGFSTATLPFTGGLEMSVKVE